MVRIGAGLYAAAAVVTFVVPNPLGANITRLGMFVLAPVLVAGAARRRPVVLVALVAALVWWQWSPAVDGMVRSGRDPSTQAAYYAPLLDALARQPGPIGRIEIPFSQRHFEAAFVAPFVPIARGWERQVDMRVNPLFYARGPLDPARYRDWLDDNGVRVRRPARCRARPVGAWPRPSSSSGARRSCGRCGGALTGGCGRWWAAPAWSTDRRRWWARPRTP